MNTPNVIRTDIRPGIFIAIPIFGGMSHAFHNVCNEVLSNIMLNEGIQAEFCRPIAESVIQHARNSLFTQFLCKTNYSHMLFIDSDIKYNPRTVIQMFQSGLDFCGGIYCKKQMHWERYEKAIKAGYAGQKARSLSVDVAAQLKYNNDGSYDTLKLDNGAEFIKCERIATGFMMFTRDAALEMVDAYHSNGKDVYRIHGGEDGYRNDFDIFTPMTIETGGGVRVGEDYGFCNKWSKLGKDIWALRNCPLSHIGTTEYFFNINDTLVDLENNTGHITGDRGVILESIPDDFDVSVYR